MAPGRQELRAWRKENDVSDQRFSITLSEEVSVSGIDVPFEELLAIELHKTEGNGSKLATAIGKKTRKRSFLKKGARGWWMRRPDAKQKVVKHTLASNKEVEMKTVPAMQRRLQERGDLSSSVSLVKPLLPALKQEQTVMNAPQTLSPPVSSIRQMQYIDKGMDEVQQLMMKNDDFVAWKNASLRSTTSTDIMGMQNVRQSYEARQKHEANDMAEFEAIERDLAAEKEAFMMEKQQKEQDWTVEEREQIYCDNQLEAHHWGLPYLSFVSDLHEQEELRRQRDRQDSFFDGSMDGEIDSALVFDNYSAQSKDDGMSEQDGFTYQLRDHIGNGNRFGNSPSDLSAVSFDDSVPWDDGLSLQPRQSVVHDQSSNIAAAGLLVSSHKRDCSTGVGVRHQATKRGAYIAEHGGDGTNALGQNKSNVPDFIPEGNAPVSSLVQHMFGNFEQDENSSSVSPSYKDDMKSSGDNTSINAARRNPSLPPPPPVQDRSLSTSKQKLLVKQKPPVTRTSTTEVKRDDKRTEQAKVKTAALSCVPGNQKSGFRNDKPSHSLDHSAQPADFGMILPAVIEEKLYELEAEIKFYKSETLQLQKRKNYYDQEVKKLAFERDEFERFQQEQRLLIEREWERERTKMKKEAKLQERQWKLRMDASISHQGRKDYGEVEMLKSQIVKMQIDENAGASKWMAENDNLRQRVSELEERNRELADDIKFLEKDRLTQWKNDECFSKETQEASGLASKSGVTSTVPSVLSEKNELRVMDDVVAIKGTADELLQRWKYPHESSPNIHDENDATASTAYQIGVQSNAVDSYNRKRYSFDRENSHPLSESGTLTGRNESERPSVNDIDSDADQKSNNREENGAISASMSPLSDHKVVTQEIERTSGKKELLYTDGSRKIIFPDGNEKNIDAKGHAIIKFTNGDHKELFPDTGISVYYYYEAQTKLTTYPDNRKVYEFPNQQIETNLPDGTTEIQFADGIKKTVRPNGDEFTVFPDGTTMLEQLNGLREVTLLNQKKICYFPDGQMVCVAPSGQETCVRSDSELKQLMENT